ncbi:hypothetical protein [Haladaptatus salinisoli]|uniref:hypothetical protein n=1 Tax=Haladaptatus salinisoli TaxID=2884876 RepID=UPI001D0AC362|nr:hypothetical protein [Haladaptatus salinisoli]
MTARADGVPGFAFGFAELVEVAEFRPSRSYRGIVVPPENRAARGRIRACAVVYSRYVA